MSPSSLPVLRRAATLSALLALTVPVTGALGAVASAEEPVVASTSMPQPLSKADMNGVGANQSGPYDSTRDGSPSGNGVGDGAAVGQPCAGCVGAADNKNPQGQLPDAERDGNNGFECDANNGIGRSNPAHTGCTAAPVVTETPAPVVTETPAPVVVVTPNPVITQTPAPVVTQTPAPVVTQTPAPVVVVTPAPIVTQLPAPVVVETVAATAPVSGSTNSAATAAVAPAVAPQAPAEQAPVVETPAVPTLGAGSTVVAPLAGTAVLSGRSQALPAALAPTALARAAAAPAVAAPGAVTPTSVRPAALPFTGGETVVLALLGGVLVLTGGTALLAGRRPVTV